MQGVESVTARIVGLRIQDARQRAMLTHRAVEQLAGVPAEQVAAFESGDVLPDIATLVRIAHAFELDPAVFVSGIQPPVLMVEPEPARVHDLERERQRRRPAGEG